MSKKDETDWFKWAGINENERDKLLVEAKKTNVPIFESDSEPEIFSRILAAKTYQSNKNTVVINACLTIISFVSALTIIFDVLTK